MSLALESLPTWILSSAATRSHQILHQRLAASGVDGYEYRCLMALVSGGQSSQAAIGNVAALDPGDVTRTLRALEARGLVARASDPNHGRRVLVCLTAEGSRMAEQLTDVMISVQNEVFGQLSDGDRSKLLTLLERVGR